MKSSSTKPSRGKYTIADMRDYEKTPETICLMNKLEKGHKSAEEAPLISPEKLSAYFQRRANEV